MLATWIATPGREHHREGPGQVLDGSEEASTVTGHQRQPDRVAATTSVCLRLAPRRPRTERPQGADQ